jgi:tetratricopeptide (TPR) repeat protein
LGAAYLALHQPEKAIPVLQKAVSIFPKYEFPQFNLARAFLQLHQDDRAAAEFNNAIKISDTANTRNSAAYELAQAKTHLAIAETWSAQSIQSVELELSQAKIPLQPAIIRRVGSIAAYWDTLGWIKFQQGNVDLAEKYLRAAAQLADDSTIVTHLGKVYETQGRNSDAIQAYAESLASIPATREMDDDEKEAHSRLLSLLGSQSVVDDRVKQSRASIGGRRSVSIPNSAGVEGFAQYAVIVGPGSKLLDVQALSPEDALTDLRSTLLSVTVPQSFPDDTIQKLPRTGTLACPRAQLPCTLTFTTAASASRVVSAD